MTSERVCAGWATYWFLRSAGSEPPEAGFRSVSARHLLHHVRRRPYDRRRLLSGLCLPISLRDEPQLSHTRDSHFSGASSRLMAPVSDDVSSLAHQDIDVTDLIASMSDGRAVWTRSPGIAACRSRLRTPKPHHISAMHLEPKASTRPRSTSSRKPSLSPGLKAWRASERRWLRGKGGIVQSVSACRF
jgi:hypothetical protein